MPGSEARAQLWWCACDICPCQGLFTKHIPGSKYCPRCRAWGIRVHNPGPYPSISVRRGDHGVAMSPPQEQMCYLRAETCAFSVNSHSSLLSLIFCFCFIRQGKLLSCGQWMYSQDLSIELTDPTPMPFPHRLYSCLRGEPVYLWGMGVGVLKNDGGVNGKWKLAKTGMGRQREVESLMRYKGRQITKYHQSTPLYSFYFAKC